MGQQECLANQLPYILLEQTTAKLETVNYKKAKELGFVCFFQLFDSSNANKKNHARPRSSSSDPSGL